MDSNSLLSRLRLSVTATLLLASSVILGEELTDRFETTERTIDTYDLLPETTLPHLSECEDGCHVGIKGLSQTILIPVTEFGRITGSPTLIEEPVGMENLYLIDLPLRQGSHLLQIGEDQFGVWVFGNGEMAFARPKSAVTDASTAYTIAPRFFGGPPGGGTFDPTDDDACPTRQIITYSSCDRLADGSVKLIMVIETRDCFGNLIEKEDFSDTIGPPLSNLISCG